MEKIDFSSRVTVPEQVIAKRLDDEMVILHLTSETYFGLNGMATAMWQELTTANSVEEAYDSLLGQYEVEPDALRSDMVDLLQQLVKMQIVELSSA